MLRRVLGLTCLDERPLYAARLSPLLALVHWLPLLLNSPGRSALALLDNCTAPLGDLLAMVQQRLCPLLGQLMRFTLNLARLDVMRLLMMGDLLRQGSPISLRREPATQLGRHQILMGCLPWRRLAGHRPLTAPPSQPSRRSSLNLSWG